MSDPESAGWTPETLKAVMDERDKRYEQRFNASQKAIDEATRANEKRFEAVNEFRGAMSDAARKYITREEARSMVAQACLITGTVVSVAVFVLNFFLHK